MYIEFLSNSLIEGTIENTVFDRLCKTAHAIEDTMAWIKKTRCRLRNSLLIH